MPTGWRKNYLRYQAFFLNIVAVYKQRQDIRSFLEILLSIGAVSLFITLAIRPTVLTITQLLRDINEKQATAKLMDQKIQNLNSAQAVFSQDAGKIALLSSAMPNSPSPELFTRQIEGTAAKNGVTILSLGVNEITLVGKELPPKNAGGVIALPAGAKEMGISMSITGPYLNLFGFLSNLENLRRPIKIDSLTISSVKTESAKTLVLVVSGRVPYIQ